MPNDDPRKNHRYLRGSRLSGWDEGMRMLGLTDVIGIEWDAAACATAEAAGHRRIQADVAALDPLGWPCWGKVSSPPCFVAGTPVVTERAVLPIEEVRVGDRVLTHAGRWCRVESTGSKVAETVTVKGQGTSGITCTPDHRFYTRTYRTWVSGRTRARVEEWGDPTWTPATELGGSRWAIPATAASVAWSAPIDPWLVGRWLADGWCNLGRGEVLWAIGDEKLDEFKARCNLPVAYAAMDGFARIFRSWGYSVWTGDLCAADYGVPQTRTRRILTASRVRTVGPPPPTHSESAHGDDLLGGHTLPWVTMAEALGWAEADVIRPNRGSGFVERHGDRPDFPATRPAPVVIGKSRSWERIVTNQRTSQTGEYYERSADEPAPTLTTNTGRWKFAPRPGERPPVYVNGNQENAARRSADEPAPTVLFGHRSNDVRWALDRPATTVVGSFRPDVIAGPGHHATSRQDAPGSVRVTVQEAAILQSFRPDYEWSGSRTKQYEQCGNAIPPRLAAHIVASAIGIDPTAAIDRYYAEALGGAA